MQSSYYRQLVQDYLDLAFQGSDHLTLGHWGVYRVYYIPSITAVTPLRGVSLHPMFPRLDTAKSCMKMLGVWYDGSDSRTGSIDKIETHDLVLAWPKNHYHDYYPVLICAMGNDVPTSAEMLGKDFLRAFSVHSQNWGILPEQVHT